MNKTLLIVRHAHRDTNRGHSVDNGLSEKGYKQAKRIKKFFKKEHGDVKKVVLLSSPKARCRETLEPLAEYLNQTVDTRDLLDEGDALVKRAKAFATWWQTKGPEFCVVCSHGDWIPELTKALLGSAIDLQKGGCIEVENRDKSAHLRWVLQELED